MNFFKTTITTLCAIGLSSALFAQEASGYQVSKTFHIASEGGWDYIAVGPGNNLLYASHGVQVNILNKTNGDSVGVIPNTLGVHGIAFIPDLNKGYTSNGRQNNVTVFDLKSNAVITQIATGENPDAIIYEPYSKKIVTCNGRSKNLSIIDPATNAVIATVAIGGKPETAVSDEKGKLFVNNEDGSEIVVVDMKAFKVLNHWSIKPGEGPTGLAIDLKTKRLFAGCDKLLIVVNADDGKIVSKIPIGDGCDGVKFDPQLNFIFASCGEGVLSIIKEEKNDKFTSFENVPTKRGARTLDVDMQTHEVFLPTADFEPNTPAGERPKMKAGTFQVLVAALHK